MSRNFEIEELTRVVNNLAVKAAEISLSREGQNADTDPAKIALALLNKYNIAKEPMMESVANDLGIRLIR